MDKQQRRWFPSRLAVTAAIVAGVAVGSYGIAAPPAGRARARARPRPERRSPGHRSAATIRRSPVTPSPR